MASGLAKRHKDCPQRGNCLLLHYRWLRVRSRRIHSRMYGEWLTSRIPSRSHWFRKRTTSTSTSVTSLSCSIAPEPLASSCLATSGRSAARIRPISLTVVPRLSTVFSIFKVTSQHINATSGPFETTARTGGYNRDDADFLANAELSAESRELKGNVV